MLHTQAICGPIVAPYPMAQRGADLATSEPSLSLGMGTYRALSCSNPVSARQFFIDCPWLNIPGDRKAEIFIEPLYPRGGLLGGASQGPPKMSKLAALAAARKKENERSLKDPAKTNSNSVALLDRLSTNSKLGGSGTPNKDTEGTQGPRVALSSASARKYPTKKRSPSPKKFKPPRKITPPSQESSIQEDEQIAPVFAAPSLFALTMLGLSPHTSATPILRTAYNAFHSISDTDIVDSNPFAGASPDDVVANAQSNSKGLGTSKSSKKSKDVPNGINTVTSDLSKIIISEAPRPKNKNINVVEEYNKSKRKKSANFVVIGKYLDLLSSVWWFST